MNPSFRNLFMKKLTRERVVAPARARGLLSPAGYIRPAGHLCPKTRAGGFRSARGCDSFLAAGGTSARFWSLLSSETQETDMGFGKGALLWLLGIPLPIIILLALFWR